MWWLGLVACALPGVSESFPDTGPSDVTTETESPPERYRWEPLEPLTASPELPWGISEAWRSSATDGIYIASAGGEAVRFVQDSWLQPRGEACLDGVYIDGSCGGILHEAGVISTTVSRSLCFDDEDQQLYLLKSSGILEVVGTARDGLTWKTYNRVYDVIRPETDEAYTPARCAARGGRMVMASERRVFGVDLGDSWESNEPAVLAHRPTQLEFVGDTSWLVARTIAGDVYLVDTTDLQAVAVGEALVDDHSAGRIAIDHTRHLVWVAVDDGLDWYALDGSGVAESGRVALDGSPRRLVVSQRDGWVATTWEEDGEARLGLVDRDGVQLEETLDAPPALLVPPGHRREIGWLTPASPPTDTGDTGAAEVTHGLEVREVQLVDDARPPLVAFAVTTLEEPFTNSEMPCTEADVESAGDEYFAELLEQLRDNLAVVDELGIPLAVGVTWEFVEKADECGELGILDDLADAGMDLGYMVHHKPCYSCTDEDVDGEDPELCLPTDADYAQATSTSACWPSDEEYCAPGDLECWLAYTSPRALTVDEALPGGAHFVFGADRHALWDWDWVQGYQRFARADGSTGYPLTLFAGSWSYPQTTGTDDPRGKDHFPREAYLRGRTWHMRSLDDLTLDSSFSTMTYLPGSSIAVSRLYEQALSDLSMGHVIEELSSSTTTADFEVALASLRQARDRRGEAPSSWYFHLPDLTGYPLVPDDTRTPVGELVTAFAAEVDTRWGAAGDGSVSWGSPTALDEALE